MRGKQQLSLHCGDLSNPLSVMFKFSICSTVQSRTQNSKYSIKGISLNSMNANHRNDEDQRILCQITPKLIYLWLCNFLSRNTQYKHESYDLLHNIFRLFAIYVHASTPLCFVWWKRSFWNMLTSFTWAEILKPSGGAGRGGGCKLLV